MTAPFVRLFVRYGLQAALVLAPLLTMGFSLLNLIGHSAAGPTDPVQVLFLSGPKQEVELQLRVLITVAALACTLMFEAVDLYLPSRSLLRFRKHYLEEQNKEWRSKLIDDVRINIMYARRRWYFLWLFVKAFDWTWNDGFAHPNEHIDANLWMCEFQGLCGRAFRTGKPQSVYFDGGQPMTFRDTWLFGNAFRLSGWQLRRTAHLKAVISVPILDQSDDLSPSYKSVGVINLDTSTDAGATKLRDNEEALTEYFMRLGKILAALRL
jgi:hypothetical protein